MVIIPHHIIEYQEQTGPTNNNTIIIGIIIIIALEVLLRCFGGILSNWST